MFENDFYTESDKPKSLKDTRKTCEELYKYLNKHFEYGIVKDGKLKTHISNKDIAKYYRFQSPDEFEQHGGGICFDYVEYEEAWLKQHDITCRKFYLITETPPDYDTHTFVVIETEGKFIWVESSMKNSQGVHVFSKLRDLLKMAAWGCFRGSRNKEHLNGVKYSVFEYTNNHPKYGCEIGEYMDWMIEHGKWVFDDMAKKERPQIVEEAATLSRRGVSGWKHTNATYEEKRNFERIMSFNTEVVYLRKEMRHMTSREIVQRLASLYNKLAEVYDTIEEDYTEVPMKTSRLGFTRRPERKSMSHRNYIDRLIYEIRDNVVELNRRFNRDGAKIVIEKMMDVWEYEKRELHINDHIGDKLVGNLTEKVSHAVLDKVMDSYVDRFYTGEEDLYQEDVHEPENRNKLAEAYSEKICDINKKYNKLRSKIVIDNQNVNAYIPTIRKMYNDTDESTKKFIEDLQTTVGDSENPTWLKHIKLSTKTLLGMAEKRLNELDKKPSIMKFVVFDNVFMETFSQLLKAANKLPGIHLSINIPYAPKVRVQVGYYEETIVDSDLMMEAKLSTDDRKELDDSQFGIPELRKYPLTDKKHVLQAVRFFNKAPSEYKHELAKNIVKRAKELGMDWESWESLKPYLDKKKKDEVVEESAKSYEIRKVKEFPFDKVYFGSHIDYGKGIDLDRPLFVTPYKRCASIYAVVHNHKVMQVGKHCHDQGIKPEKDGAYHSNFGYDEWEDLNESNRDQYCDTVHVRIEGYPELKEYTVNGTGYVYEIDVSELKDHIGRYDWMSSGDREFLIHGLDHIDFSKKDKINVKCIVKGYPRKHHVQEAAQHKPMYFYHMIDKSVKLDDKGLKTPDYVLTKEHDEDLYLKMTEKYRYRLTHGWNIYPDKKPEDLTSDQVYDGINQFRKSKRGNNQIYMFRYPPYKELGPHMADLLKDKEIYAFDINDPNNQKYINAIDWGWDGSNTDNEKLNRQWYENISKEDYFKKYDDNGKPLFAPLNHISIDPSKGFLPLSCLQKSSEVIQETYHSYQEAVDINSLRQQCGEVYQQALQIHYGCLDENGERITASPFKDSWKMISTYHSQSIQSMEQTKLGVCFEHSFYVAKLLKDRGLPCQTFFLNCNIDHNQPQEETEDIQQESESIAIEQHNMNNMSFWHQFTIVPNDTDSIVLIETSLTPEKNGVFLVRNMDDAVQHLIQTFGLNLSSQDFEVMKQDLIDVSTFEPRDGDTYIGYIDQVYLNGKFIKNEIRINHQTKTMKTYWNYLQEHDYLSEDGVKINEQIQQMDDNTAFDIINLLNANQIFTEEGLKFHQAFFTPDKPQLSVSEMESQLKGFVQESYLPNRTNNTLKEKYHYIPLTPQSKKKYQDQGVFRFGLRKTNVDNDTKGAIYIDENHVVVGYVAIKKKMNGQRWITALEVSEEFQGHHYGVDLLQIAVDDFGAEYLSVNKKNEKAIHMYKKYGWETYDENDHMFYMKLQGKE